jgi:hypothetical protein
MEQNMKKVITLTMLALLAAAGSAFATSITLYDQPAANAKAIGSLESSAGVITIFTPKDNKTWTKVADPRNGNVGWIKSSDLNNVGFSFNITTSGGNGQNTNIVQYGNMTPEQVEQNNQRLQKIRAQQEALQRDMQQMMQEMFKDVHYPVGNYPMIVPVIVVPEKMLPQQRSVSFQPIKKAGAATTTTTMPASNTMIAPGTPTTTTNTPATTTSKTTDTH